MGWGGVQAVPQTFEELVASADLVELDVLVRNVCLLDRAGAIDHGVDTDAAVEAGLGAVGHPELPSSASSVRPPLRKASADPAGSGASAGDVDEPSRVTAVCGSIRRIARSKSAS